MKFELPIAVIKYNIAVLKEQLQLVERMKESGNAELAQELEDRTIAQIEECEEAIKILEREAAKWEESVKG